MAKFRDVKTLRKFASTDASVTNFFNLERHLISREIFRPRRGVALDQWCQHAA
jgi:putative transposase